MRRRRSPGRSRVSSALWSTMWMMLLTGLSTLSGCEKLWEDDRPSQELEAASFDAEVALAWYDLSLELAERMPGCTPPVVARSFGYTGVALYEALRPGMPEHVSLQGQLNGELLVPAMEQGEHHWPTVANAVLAEMHRVLFTAASAEDLARIEALDQQWSERFRAEVDPEVFERSVARGRAVAAAVYAWSLDDGGHEGHLKNFPADYAMPVGTGLWQPVPPADGGPPPGALQPNWGRNRPFVLPAGGNPNASCDPGTHPTYSEDPGSSFYAEAMEVYDAVTWATPEQLEIARFWSDDPGKTSTPPGHSISVATQVLRQEGATLDRAAEVYARVGMAVSDAFVACWHTKFQTNLLRPVTYLRQVVDPAWTPILATPPFPEYTSGHSVQSGAAFQVLTDLFGDGYAFVDRTHERRGMAPRSFGSFFEAAEEAAWSRLYGGIHFRAAIVNGVAQGRCIGQKVSGLRWRR